MWGECRLPAAGSVLLLPAAGEPVPTLSSQKLTVRLGRQADHDPLDPAPENVVQQVIPGVGDEPGVVLAGGDACEPHATGVGLDQSLLAVGAHGVVADDDSHPGGKEPVLLHDDAVRRKGERTRGAARDEVHVEDSAVLGVGEPDEREVRLTAVRVVGEGRVRLVGFQAPRPGDVGPADAGGLVVVCDQQGDAVDGDDAQKGCTSDDAPGALGVVSVRLVQAHARGCERGVKHECNSPGVHLGSLCEAESERCR